jgi:hypothetical protein
MIGGVRRGAGKAAHAALLIGLVGCGGGTTATMDGGPGHGGATATGGASGAGGAGTASGGGGGAGSGGTAGTAAGTGGASSGGTAGAATGTGGASSGGAAGTSAGTGGVGGAGTGGAAGSGGAAGAAGAATGGLAGGGIGGMNCRPDVLLLQDKSGSMSNNDLDMSCTGGCGANSKWAELTTAVTNVLGATDGKVNWGLKYFSDNALCDASMPPAVPIAAMNGTAVVTSLAANAPGGNTPTRDAITYGMMYLQTLTDTNPKFLLLATDGLPNCPAGCASMTKPTTACTMTDNPSEDAAAAAAVMMAATQGIKTFVVGIGDVSSALNTLNQLAIEGGEAQTGGATSYYAATDEAALEAALTAIVGKIAGCPGNP